jgi:hypothetical protein
MQEVEGRHSEVGGRGGHPQRNGRVSRLAAYGDR